MAITAAQVKELREMTGAGMMDCKKALTATEGDMDKAVEFLARKRSCKSTKKAGRIAAEGLCKAYRCRGCKRSSRSLKLTLRQTSLLRMKFQSICCRCCEQALTTKAADIDAFLQRMGKAELELRL